MAKGLADARTVRGRYRTLDHTADICIEIDAGTLEELFALSACAMFDLMIDLSQVRPAQKAEVSLNADSPEDLLITWLNELIFRADVSGMFFSKFEVESVGENSLEASVWGEPYQESKHSVERTIKAATYHESAVSQSGGKWSARVILDV